MKWLCALALGLILTGCDSQQDVKTEKPKPEIEELMRLQEDAWNQGDLHGFMQAYWQNDSLLFIGSRGPTYGWQTTLDNYKKSYPSKEEMGTLRFENLVFKSVDQSHFWVAGSWTLFRQTDTLSGHYTLLWKHTKTGWKIITDHSS